VEISESFVQSGERRGPHGRRSPLLALARRRPSRFCAALAISIWLFANPLLAQDQPTDEAANLPLWNGAWQPPERDRRGWDWVRLKTNEWVKGEILLMRDFDLRFNSDEFGDVVFSWEDVREIVSERGHIFILNDLRTRYLGTMIMRGDQISVRVGERVETFDRSRLLAITPSTHREINLWYARAVFGLGLRAGNTEQADITGQAKVWREGANTRFVADYNGVYSSFDQLKNTNNHRGHLTLDYFLTPNFFLVPGDFEVFTDEFQNISYRLTPTLGAGYFLIRRAKVDWEARLTTGYQHTRSDSAVANGSKTADNSAFVFSSEIDAELTSYVDLILSYQLQFIAPDTNRTNHHSRAALEIELTSIIDLDVSFVWDRIEKPETESDGETPKTNDFRLTVGLAIEF